MKKILPYLFLIFTAPSFAQLIQDWDISPLGQKTYFERDDGYLEMYYNDSTEVFTDFRKHYFGQKYYRGMFEDCYEEVRDHVDNIFDHIFYPSLEERFLLEEWYSNDNFFYTINGNDTIKFYHKAPVDFEWIMHIQYDNFDSILVKCESIVTEPVLGIMDSVRVYKIQTYNNGFPTGSVFNNRDIKLSKKFGWVSFTPFYSWIKGTISRTQDEEYKILGWEKDGVREGIVPNFNMFFEAYQVSDIYKWHYQSPVFFASPTGINRWHLDSISHIDFVSDSLLKITYNSSQIEITRNFGDRDTSFNFFEGWEKSYLKKDYDVLFDTPPDYIFLDGSITHIKSIQKDHLGQLRFEVNTLEWFDPWDCIPLTTESTFNKTYTSDIGLNYSYRDGVFGDDLTELLGFKRNGIIEGNIDLEFCAFPTSTIDILKSEIKISPNPTSDFIHLDFSNYENEISKITIYDALGYVLLEKHNDLTASVSVSNFPNGFYFVKISSSFGDMIHKFVKH